MGFNRFLSRISPLLGPGRSLPQRPRSAPAALTHDASQALLRKRVRSGPAAIAAAIRGGAA